MNYIRRHEYRPNYENGTVCQNNIVFPLTIGNESVMVVGMVTTYQLGDDDEFSIYNPDEDRYYELDEQEYPKYFAVIK